MFVTLGEYSYCSFLLTEGAIRVRQFPESADKFQRIKENIESILHSLDTSRGELNLYADFVRDSVGEKSLLFGIIGFLVGIISLLFSGFCNFVEDPILRTLGLLLLALLGVWSFVYLTSEVTEET